MKNFDTIIIGSGCAGFNSADWLYDFGVTNIAVLTEGIQMGTSRNTGSDKQTYYKLSLSGENLDSINEMAKTLFSGGSVNGDHALIEAACSVRGFMKLVNLGVPFPTNKYGEFVGYKTDHDPRERGTSCGPLTSKLMTEALENSVMTKQIPIFDGYQVIKIVTENEKVTGVVALNLETFDFEIFACNNIILATGGPAGVYFKSVYPESQTGATGLAIEAGAKLSNFGEWQYGLASTKFRWNVSGTYQQVLPKYISIDKNGVEREFLLDYFDDPKKALDMVFLKGYQWPFDSAKVQGSSYIDIIIDKEINEKGNRVFMDFRENPTGLEDGFDKLAPETFNYLEKSSALLETPIKRLEKMNKKAIELYAEHFIDLYTEPLEVAVCAQHCNGGVDVDMNWETNISGLYVVGEAAGTFGIYRPGGSALNSTQVGSMRAAEHIAFIKSNEFKEPICTYNFKLQNVKYGQSNIIEKRIETQKLMSKYAAYIRNTEKIKELCSIFQEKLNNFEEENTISSKTELAEYFKNKDILTTQISLLNAILFSCINVGSRGSSLVSPELVSGDKHTGEVIITTSELISNFKAVRKIPVEDNWFENVWNEFNKIRKI